MALGQSKNAGYVPNKPGKGKKGKGQGHKKGHGNHPNRNHGGGGNRAPGKDQQLLAAGYTPQEILTAKANAGQQYGPQIGVVKQTLGNIPGYFQDYRNQITGAQQRTQQLANPVIGQAQQAAQGMGQTVLGPGVDPTAAANDKLAAAARQAQGTQMAQLLQGLQQTNNNYFGQTYANSGLQQAGAQRDLRGQLGTLRGQQAGAVASNLGDLHEANRQYGLAVQTLLSGNQIKALETRLGAKTDLAKIKATTNTNNAKFQAQYGVSPSTWKKMSPKERLAWKRAWNKSPQTATDKLTTARLKYFRKHGVFPGTKSTSSGSTTSDKDAFGNTPRQQRAANSQWDKVRAIAGQIVQPNDSWRSIYKLLAVKYPTADSSILKAAAMRVTGTHIPNGVLSQLKQQGVNVGQIKNPKKRRNQKPNLSGTTGTTPGANGQQRPG